MDPTETEHADSRPRQEGNHGPGHVDDIDDQWQRNPAEPAGRASTARAEDDLEEDEAAARRRSQSTTGRPSAAGVGGDEDQKESSPPPPADAGLGRRESISKDDVQVHPLIQRAFHGKDDLGAVQCVPDPASVWSVLSNPPREIQHSEVRDHLANERTFMAWTRTALSIAALGVVVLRAFNDDIRFVASGVLLTILGLVYLLYAGYRYYSMMILIQRGRYEPTKWAVLVLTLATVALSATVAGLMTARVTGRTLVG